LTRSPYSPAGYIELSKVDNKLGFSDIGAANAYRALILVRAGLSIDKNTHPKSLGDDVRNCMTSRTDVGSGARVLRRLKILHLKALKELLFSLLESGAFWEGLLEAKKALALFPTDKVLIDTEIKLRDGFTTKCGITEDSDEEMEEREDNEAVAAHNRQGGIYQKPYPWLDNALYSRTPTVIKEVNQSFGAMNCEVRPISFSKGSEFVKEASGCLDIGPVGVFATKNIRQGELLMVDRSFICVSDVPSSQLVHCDACHASLIAPYMNPACIIKPSCCGKVTYCSVECYEAASKGFHSIVCGKDIEWLYQDTEGRYSKKAAKGRALSILFHRLMSMVLSDRRAQVAAGQKPLHPLQHPLIIRMTANYPPQFKIHQKQISPWRYSDSIVTTHRILQELDVNVFTTPEFTPEVIQTICWRIENNSSISITNLSLDTGMDKHYPAKTGLCRNIEDDVQITSLSPNYLFFNHSCEPNLEWHGSNPNPWVGISYLKGFNGEILKPGCSAIWLHANRDVVDGEQLMISYVGDVLGKNQKDREFKRYLLAKWFDGGCGCKVCQREEAEEG
jgi:hypothetical protein